VVGRPLSRSPFRVSAGFLVAGLSGDRPPRIQILPRALDRGGSYGASGRLDLAACDPGRLERDQAEFAKSHGSPPLAMPDIRPRWTLRCLTRRGIQHGYTPPPMTAVAATGSRRGFSARDLAAVKIQTFTPMRPYVVSAWTLRVADIGSERAEWDSAFLVPLSTGHLRPTQASGNGDLDALGARPSSSSEMACFNRLLKGDAGETAAD